MKTCNTTLATTALAGMLAMPAAHAGFLAGFTGWTEMNDCPPCDGTVNFALYANTDGNWLDDDHFSGFTARTLAGSVTGTESFVYFCQPINSNNNDPAGFPPEAELGELQLRNRSNDAALFSGGGYFEAVFDDGAPVLGGENGNYTVAVDDYAGNAYPALGEATVGDDTAPDLHPSSERNGGENNLIRTPAAASSPVPAAICPPRRPCPARWRCSVSDWPAWVSRAAAVAHGRVLRSQGFLP